MNIMTEDRKVIDLLKKHKPLTTEDIKKQIEDQEKAKEEYASSITEIENDLLNFLNEDHPVLHPTKDKPLFWVRQPTFKELEKWRTRFKKVRKMTEAQAEEYLETDEGQMGQFAIMADIITQPKKDAEYWKEHSNPTLEKLFEAKLVELLEKAYGSVSFF